MKIAILEDYQNIATSLADWVRMGTIAWSQNLTPETAAGHGVRAVTKQQRFTESDALSIHVVLSERTRWLPLRSCGR
jgi:phosphoglycerate dehydrogenase-like enzyme